MATKHFYSNTDGLVVKALTGVASTNPSLGVSAKDKVLFNREHNRKKVSLLSGGGSGHEPAHSGYVGKGMLDAAVCGDVFASPNTKQIQAGCDLVPSDEGYVFIVTNYTGDMLHFGLAAEKINASGHGRAAIIQAADDVSVGRKTGGLVGRRGLAGTIVTNKILGAAAEAGRNFDEVVSLGKAVQGSLVTINAGLDHCHIPGHGKDYGQLKDNQIEIGLGIHNEPGVKMLEQIPEAKSLVEQLLQPLLDQNDADRSFVNFGKGGSERVALLINNLGGVPLIEQYALTNEVVAGLNSKYSIVPVRVYSGHFMTSLNANIFSITLLNVSECARQSGLSEDTVMKYLDAPTDAVAWPQNHYTNSKPINLAAQVLEDRPAPVAKPQRSKDLRVGPQALQAALRLAADNVIKAEPKLTEWDTKMGDGDCGMTLESGARGLLAALDEGVAADGSILATLDAVVDITEEKMGGTLGAIFGIYFAALQNAVRQRIESAKDESALSILVDAACDALTNLRTHTPASEGDRTVMDVLIPYCKSLAESRDTKAAAEVAHRAAEGTRKIKPKLGRATYVGGLDDAQELPPDPGAWGLYEIVRAL